MNHYHPIIVNIEFECEQKSIEYIKTHCIEKYNIESNEFNKVKSELEHKFLNFRKEFIINYLRKKSDSLFQEYVKICNEQLNNQYDKAIEIRNEIYNIYDTLETLQGRVSNKECLRYIFESCGVFKYNMFIETLDITEKEIFNSKFKEIINITVKDK
jgi:hypothetical protein